MNPSVIVHGPMGCGKTRNRARIAHHFRLDEVHDSWGPTQVPRAFGVLYLTSFEPQGSLELHGRFCGIELVSYASLKAKGVVS